jgi:hypothetical protein
MSRRPVTKYVAVIGALAVSPVVGLVALYNMPVSIALGPCLKDWTSPSSFSRRASPLATVTFSVDGRPVKVCYSRPSARERVIFGGLVPFGRLWRTGANEPTRIFTSSDIRLGGIELRAGRYSVYSRPGATEWEIFASRSTFHWGNEISESVRAREVGQTTIPVQTLDSPVEQFTVRPITTPAGVTLLIEWEHTRVALPIEALN